MSTLLAVLDAVATQRAAIALRARSYEFLGDLTDRTVLDTGCESGRAVAELADRGRLVHAKADTLPSPPRYRNLLLDAGLTDPVVEAHPSVFTDDTALAVLRRITDEASWLAEHTERARADRIFLAVPMFLVSARR